MAFTYDNAVVLFAYLGRGKRRDLKRAEMLADALVYAQENDRFYTDGRLRNAYQAGDLISPPGWIPNGRANTVRLPGWWDPDTDEWLESSDHVGTSTGNMAWVMVGLLRAYEEIGKTSYLEAAAHLGNWVIDHTRSASGGFTGGFEGWEPAPTAVSWKSTEHNLDLYVGFMKLWDHQGLADWQENALHAKNFVRSMWEACGADHFATGTHPDGVTPNCDFAPADVNTWGLMALGESDTYGAGIDWVTTHTRVEELCGTPKIATGFDFNDDRDGIWWEGTAHTVIALRILGDKAGAKAFLKEIRRAQKRAPNGNKKGIVATCHDGVSTGIVGFSFFNRLHIAATGWYALAELGVNPFWGVRTKDPIPHEGE